MKIVLRLKQIRNQQVKTSPSPCDNRVNTLSIENGGITKASLSAPDKVLLSLDAPIVSSRSCHHTFACTNETHTFAHGG